MQTIRWGIIGCGNVTEVKSGPGFQKARNSDLVAVMRRTGKLAADYARRHHVPRWYDEGRALINDPDVDAVYIATPPSTHLQYTLLAAEAGKPVYVEKPMAMNFRECEAMIQACRTAGVPLWVAYYRRMLPRFLKVKELLAAGAIGDVRFVHVTLYRPPQSTDSANPPPWRVQPEIAGGGYYVDLASHILDYLDYFFGPICAVQGFATNQAQLYTAEDIVTGSFLFESGIHGVGAWCFTAYADVDLTEIVGTQGKLSFSTFGTEPVLLTTGDGSITEFPEATPLHVQQPLIQSIVDELNGVGRCPSTGVSGARTSWVMDQMLRHDE